MKVIYCALLLFTGLCSHAQVSFPKKLILLGPAIHLIPELDLPPNQQYALPAGKIAARFPDLVIEKNVNERFGKNVYRTRVVRSIDQKALMPRLARALRQGELSSEDLQTLLIPTPPSK